MDLVIATGQSRKSKLWKNTKLSWDEFVDRLATTTRTSETQGEYFNMTKSQQAARSEMATENREVLKTVHCLLLTRILHQRISAMI